MKIEKSKPTLTVTFNEQELTYIKGLTQNAAGDEDSNNYAIRMELFVAVSRALGFNMNDDGSINRAIRPLLGATGV